jgi:hypothetical protein
MIEAGFGNKVRAALVALAWAAAACKGSEPAPAEKYEVRAQVVAVEGTGDDARVILEHEAIDGFKNREGKPERMPAMKMAFGIAPSVDAGDLIPGSKQAVVFDAVWGREPMIRVLEAKRLPDDTALTLGEHHP